jgi:hypothetical protein
MSAAKIQREPYGEEKFKRKFHYLGQQNKNGQYYLTRNAFSQLSEGSKDWVDSCLRDIESAFQFRKPAVISTHRVNYIGALVPANRDRGIIELKKLLRKIIQTWPSVEFMTSTELGDVISRKKQV